MREGSNRIMGKIKKDIKDMSNKDKMIKSTEQKLKEFHDRINCCLPTKNSKDLEERLQTIEDDIRHMKVSMENIADNLMAWRKMK